MGGRTWGYVYAAMIGCECGDPVERKVVAAERNIGCGDHDFGDALECAILIRREDLAPKVQQQFLAAYRSANPARFQQLRKR